MGVMMKRVIFIFKDLPKSLEEHVAKDKHMNLTKDGAVMLSGIPCARAIITIDWFNDHRDKDRIAKLTNILTSLQRQGKIFEFTLPK